MLMKLKPSSSAEECPQLPLSPPPATKDKSYPEGIQSTLLSSRGRILRAGSTPAGSSRSLHHASFSGPALILSVLEFFRPLEVAALVPDVLSLFDADDYPPSPPEGKGLTPHPSHTAADLLPNAAEASDLLDVVLTRNHPFLRFLDPKVLHALLDDVCICDRAARERRPSDAPSPPLSMTLALCHVLLALGNLMTVPPRRELQGGYERVFLKAFVASQIHMVSLPLERAAQRCIAG